MAKKRRFNRDIKVQLVISGILVGLVVWLLFYANLKVVGKVGESYDGSSSSGGGGSTGENCTAVGDEDNDGRSNCFDSECYEVVECRSQTCDYNKTVVWSYLLPNESLKFSQNQVPTRTGCCNGNQCVASGGNCHNSGDGVAGGVRLCQPDRNWYECTSDKEGDISTNGVFMCNGEEWEYRCFPENIYKRRADNTQICDGQQWRNCAYLALTPIADPWVEVTCSGDTISIRELLCNNNVDDDNDENVDSEDTDCQGAITYRLNKAGWYEVVVRNGDPAVRVRD